MVRGSFAAIRDDGAYAEYFGFGVGLDFSPGVCWSLWFVVGLVGHMTCFSHVSFLLRSLDATITADSYSV